MSTDTRINILRATPLTFDGAYLAADTHLYYTGASHYYYTVDNIPFIRHDQRDALLSEAMQQGICVGFPFKGFINKEIADSSPVIIDFQNGYIHQDFNKRQLGIDEKIGFIIKDNTTGFTFYNEIGGFRVYYVLTDMFDAIIPYNNVDTFPNNTVTKDSLAPEKTFLYVNFSGRLCTKEVDTASTGSQRMTDSNGVIVPVGVIKNIAATSTSFLAHFSGVGQFGMSGGDNALTHGQLEEIVTSNLSPAEASLWVYGHYGYRTRVIIKSTTSVDTSLNVGDSVYLTPGGTLTRYANLQPNSLGEMILNGEITNANQFLGFIFEILTQDAPPITRWFIINDGEYFNPGWNLVPGNYYYLNYKGEMVDTITGINGAEMCKVGFALNPTTLILEPNSTSFGKDINAKSDTNTAAIPNTGSQVSHNVDSSGFIGHRKFMTDIEGGSPFGVTQKTTTSTFLDNPAIPLTDTPRNYEPTHPLFANTANYEWGLKTHASGYPASLNLSGCSAAYPGVINPRGGLIIQRLSPEFPNPVGSETPGYFERILIFMYGDIPSLDKMNAADISSAGTSFPHGLPFTSASELTGHAISPTTLKYSVDNGSNYFDGVIRGFSTSVRMHISSDFSKTETTLKSVNGCFFPKHVIDTSADNRGIALKRRHGMIGLYQNLPAQPNTSGNDSYAFLYYDYYNKSGADPYNYEFFNCYIVSRSGKFDQISAKFDMVIAFPAGALSVDVQKDSGNFIAGMYNPNPHHLNWLNKHKFSWWGRMTGSTTPDILPAPFGNPKMVSNNASSLKDQSIAQIASYANFDTIRQLKEPLNVAYLGPSVNQYPYIGYSAFYGNPTKDSSYSDYAAYSTQLFRLFDSSKSGIFTEPWSGGLDDQYKDSFWFGSPWNMTLGPTLRLGNLPTWHGYSLAGVGTIIYIYRGSTNTAIEDYVDISMDTTALPYQVFMNMGETANPAVAADGTNPSRYNFDMLTFVNGEYRNFGPGDTLRLVLPPLSANDLRSNEGDRAIGTRNLPALNINYVDTTVALNSRYYNRRAIAAGTPWRSAPLIW